jgi:hypothetical protein
MSLDNFYTPRELAEKMLAATKAREPRIVADFAGGNGELLKAARSKWPHSRIIATDISRVAVRRLRKGQPGWDVERCDFLSASSRESCRTLVGLEGGVSLILLNPPFSCRGATTCRLAGDGYSIQCSRALAFVLNALRYLAPDGELICLLPAGSLHIQKDALAWMFLRTLFSANIIGRNGRGTFAGCSARTLMVRLRPRESACDPPKGPARPRTRRATMASVTLYRGKLPMYTLSPENNPASVPLVHSTCLRNSSVDFGQFKTAQTTHIISGPVVFLPRVGQPSKSKVVLYRGRRKFAMSDCVLALHSRDNLEAVYSCILSDWASISKLYMGTGAKFLRVSAVATALRRLGIEVNAPESRYYSHQLTREINLPAPALREDEVQAIASGLCGRNGHR